MSARADWKSMPSVSVSRIAFLNFKELKELLRQDGHIEKLYLHPDNKYARAYYPSESLCHSVIERLKDQPPHYLNLEMYRSDNSSVCSDASTVVSRVSNRMNSSFNTPVLDKSPGNAFSNMKTSPDNALHQSVKRRFDHLMNNENLQGFDFIHYANYIIDMTDKYLSILSLRNANNSIATSMAYSAMHVAVDAKEASKNQDKRISFNGSASGGEYRGRPRQQNGRNDALRSKSVGRAFHSNDQSRSSYTTDEDRSPQKQARFFPNHEQASATMAKRDHQSRRNTSTPLGSRNQWNGQGDEQACERWDSKPYGRGNDKVKSPSTSNDDIDFGLSPERILRGVKRCSLPNEFTEVLVTEVTSEKMGYVQLITMQDTFNKFSLDVMKAMEATCCPAKAGNMCAAEFDEAWYRAIVLSTTPSIKVHFVDFGNEIVVDKVKPLPDGCGEVPAYAIHVKLADASPVKLSENAVLRVKPLKLENDGTVVVTVERGDVSSPKPQAEKPPSALSREEILSKVKGRNLPNEFTQVVVTEVKSDKVGYVQMISLEDHFNKLALDLMEESEEAAYCPARVGHTCVALFDGAWYRAIVLSTMPDIKVFFIDYGNESVVDRVKALRDALSEIPSYAFHIKLTDKSSIKLKENDVLSVKAVRTDSDGAVIVAIEDAPLVESGPTRGQILSKVKWRSLPDEFTEVMVTEVTSDRVGYVQLNSLADEFEQFSVELMMESAEASNVSAKVGDICVAEFANMWFRAVVLSTAPMNVLFVDYGNESIVESVKPLKFKHAEVPAYALRIKLTDASPIKMVADEVMHVKPIRVDDDGTVVVATDKDGGCSSKPKTESQRKFIPQCFNLNDKAELTIENGSVQEAKFVVGIYNKTVLSYLAELDNIKLGIEVEAFEPQRGDLAIALISEEFRRVVVVEDTGPYKVAMIDYGDFTVVNKVFPVPDDLIDLPEFACMVTVDESVLPSIVGKQFFNCVINSIDKDCVKCTLQDEDFAIIGDAILTQWNPLKSDDFEEKANGLKVRVFMQVDNFLHLRTRKRDVKLKEVQKKLEQHCPTVSFLNRKPNVDDLVSSQYENVWYRAAVKEVNGNMAKIVFIDYGNEEHVPWNRLKCLPDEHKTIPPLLLKVKLKGFDASNYTPLRLEYLGKIRSTNLILTVLEGGDEVDLRLPNGECLSDVLNGIVHTRPSPMGRGKRGG